MKNKVARKEARSTLDSLAKRIKAEHQQVFTALKAGLCHARNAGELLCKAKDQVRHGEWKQWVETNCEFSIRTAQVYMQIAEGWEQIAAKAQPVALLPMGQALKLLSGQPKPVEPAASGRPHRGLCREACTFRENLTLNKWQAPKFRWWLHQFWKYELLQRGGAGALIDCWKSLTG